MKKKEDFPTITVPKRNQKPKVYLKALQDLHTQIGFESRNESDFWGRGKGWISYQQGQILNLLKESKQCKHGMYTKTVEQIGMSIKTAYNCRRIAKAFDAKHARSLGYTKMLRGLGWESVDTAGDLDDGCGPNNAEVSRPQKGGKGRNIKPTRKPKKITPDNLPQRMKAMISMANDIRAMPPAKMKRHDAIEFYENRVSEIQLLTEALDKIRADFAKRLATLTQNKGT